MLLAVLAVVALLGSLEAMGGGSVSERLLDALMAVASAAIGYWALRRYLYLLMHAEEIANQANCPNCQSYGLLQVAQVAPPKGEAQRYVPVCCKRCGCRWDVKDG